MLNATGERWTAESVSGTIRGGSLWMEILGISLIVIGGIALGAVILTSLASSYLIGALLLAAGAIQIAHPWRFWRRRWAGFFLGLALGFLYAIAGILCLVRPEAALIGLTYILGAVFIGLGILRGTYSLASRFPGWGWGGLTGLVDLLLGMLILAWWPADSLVVLGTLVAIELIVAGAQSLVTGIAVRRLVVPRTEPPPHRPITRFQH